MLIRSIIKSAKDELIISAGTEMISLVVYKRTLVVCQRINVI